ncbi:hypothetical protein HRG_009576 [Hirsutella rhossiliensis]|uniref:Uncharacterized protein n=1 Tax=Hirsutella rhossiliensis TaxID=111463 RepID=A0A9P8MQ03_9HYPO|nr:uncharacterized protein HRG_09576 [Hirsutella rhossiliensis]KAH0959115.1 hypothetical protein HRG_09576 [Hirsutella rhossiliensis]
MARPQTRRRQCADSPPAKRARQGNFSPAFWDNLSKIWLTRRALRELDRRNSTRPRPELTTPEVRPINLARLARHGGPDFCHLRGYPEPEAAMSLWQWTQPTSGPPRARRTSLYDADFEQHLADHNIYTPFYDFSDGRSPLKPANLEETLLLLTNHRPSLSLSRFTESDFVDFQRKDNATSESTIIRNVIPIITGNADIPNESNLPFTNLESLTDEDTAKAVPDFFDGARPGDIDTRVREDLNNLIRPTKHALVPVVPNFFLEVKPLTGRADVARKQACYDGAHGARAMHALQNYGETEPTYDGKAYAYSAIYHAGISILQLFAHHVVEPTTAGGYPEYRMAQLRSFSMADTRETFVQGAAVFRNARDLAKRHRDGFIQSANARAARATAMVGEERQEISASHQAHGFPHRPDDSAWQNSHDALQQHIADGSDQASQGDAEPVTEDDSQNPSQE